MLQPDDLATEDQERLAMYLEMQRSIPGLDAMYRMMHAHIIHNRSGSNAARPYRILIVGAGGGRELRELGSDNRQASITALDISGRNLETARHVARCVNMTDRTEFHEGAATDLPTEYVFDAATSMLVMHEIPDDGAKLAYLKNIRSRLRPGAVVIHADVCFENQQEYARMMPAYLAHANHMDIPEHATRLEREAVSHLAVITGDRMSDLFIEAGFNQPREVFRSLWYRCWVADCERVDERAQTNS